MPGIKLFEHQKKALENMQDGCILNGGVGSGKSRTALAYYFKENGGTIDPEKYIPMTAKPPMDLYIITTAKKRDDKEWEGELANFLMSTHPEVNYYDNTIVVNSWNTIKKYKDVRGAFFIFDEQRVVGNGAWVRSFLKIAKNNRWILLSATPGDTWSDYIPVFIANGFYRTRTEFTQEHIVYSRFTKYPKIDRYINTGRLVRLRNKILVDMDFERKTVRHHEDIWCDYNLTKYKMAGKERWDPYKDEPIRDAGSLCYIWRRIVNEDPSRSLALLDIFEKHRRLIIFYNFDYELEILKGVFNAFLPDASEREHETDDDEKGDGLDCPPREHFDIAEWNGHKHQPIPEADAWVYLVQYTAGCEGWNSIKTDTIVFYSQNYSYKVMEQAAGRIDRLNTPFTDLHYYHLKSRSGIDLAINRALKQKKKFNEGRFAGDKFR